MDWELVCAPSRPDPTWVVPTTRLVQDFVEAIMAGREPVTTIGDAAAVVDQTYGIYASHLAGMPLELPLKKREHPLKREVDPSWGFRVLDS